MRPTVPRRLHCFFKRPHSSTEQTLEISRLPCLNVVIPYQCRFTAFGQDAERLATREGVNCMCFEAVQDFFLSGG